MRYVLTANLVLSFLYTPTPTFASYMLYMKTAVGV